MFKILKEAPKCWWPVTINQPIDGGKVKKIKCKVQFNLFNDDEYQELLDKNNDKEMAMALIADWDGVGDENGNKIEASEENKQAFCKIAYVRRAIFNAYAKASIGAPEKN